MSKYSPPPPGLVAGALVWAYLRDSGGAAQERSVGQQEREIMAFCKMYHLRLGRMFSDVAKSGGSVVGREAFSALMDASEYESERPAALLIWNFARFARDYNDSVYYKALLNKRGILVHSLTDVIPADDFTGRIVENFINLTNEEKRRQTSRDVKRGLKELIGMGRGFAPGTPPRGYTTRPVEIGVKRDGKPRIVSQWIPDPLLVEDVKLAWEMRARGGSLNEIIKATGGRLYTSKNSFPTFFRNRSYLGYYGEVPDHHEPLITHEVFDAVQRLMNVTPFKRGAQHPRRVASPSLLSGLCRCAECGAMMVYGVGNKKYPWRFYMCGNKNRKGYAACPSKRIGANNAEAHFLKAVKEKILTVEYLAEVIAEAKKKFESKEKIEIEIKAARRELEDLDLSIQRTLNTIEKTGSAAAQDRLAQREAERAKAKSDLDLLLRQAEAAQVEIQPAAMQAIVSAWQERLSQLEDAGNVRELKTWLSQFVTGVELGYNKAVIHVTYKLTDAFTKQLSNVSLRGGTQQDPA